jgi:2-polyprenyl-3-methyl-5-hydroxy-6-metoxy-1,4-benzoquinol methylase
LRKIDKYSLSAFFLNSVYTDIKDESSTYNNRIKFLQYIYRLASEYKKPISSWLDFGCSYGHFVELLKKKGIEAEGIELSDNARVNSGKKGLVVYKTLNNIPSTRTYNVVSLIDSLYYEIEPKILLNEVYRILDYNGLLVLRIVNRNWLIKLNRNIFRRKICKAFGDHTTGFSKKSIRLLLTLSGFKIVKTTSIERGKKRSFSYQAFYFTSLVLKAITLGLINITPGTILLAKKNIADD